VYAPVPEPKKEGVDRHEPKATDSLEVAEWRGRMGTDDAKEIYKQRAATAECVNAQAHNRGLIQLLVRGPDTTPGSRAAGADEEVGDLGAMPKGSHSGQSLSNSPSPARACPQPASTPARAFTLPPAVLFPRLTGA
jgi:hypothetical protein